MARDLLGALLERLARALVDDHEGDVGEALALLLAQRRIGEGGEQRGDGCGAPDHAAAALQDQNQTMSASATRPAAQNSGAGTMGANSIDQLIGTCPHWPSRSSRAGTCTWSAL